MKEMLRYGSILGVICCVSAGILAFVNALTAPAIAQQKLQQENAALAQVLPQAKEFLAREAEGAVDYYLAVDAGKKPVGFVFKAQGKGYSSVIEVMVGVDTGFAVTAMQVLSQNETPGLGTQIAEPSFLSQFTGKRPDTLEAVPAIAGATVSSSALKDAVIKTLQEKKPRMEKELM
jgi:Na+-translocating ferredoxin:NAD+ oxidoreductase subunit G